MQRISRVLRYSGGWTVVRSSDEVVQQLEVFKLLRVPGKKRCVLRKVNAWLSGGDVLDISLPQVVLGHPFDLFAGGP